MVHANVTWWSKFENGGMLKRGNRENHRKPCWFPPDFFSIVFCSKICGLLSFLFAWVKFTGKINPLCLGHCLGSKHISHPPPKPAWGTKMRCWFQLLGRVNLLGERDQRCIHSQWDSASLLFYFVSPDNCMIHAILEADPGNTVCLNQPITISATALILRPCHVCETQDVTTADPALRVPFTPPPPTKNRIYWEPKCFCCGWLPKTRKSSQLNFKAGYLLN